MSMFKSYRTVAAKTLVMADRESYYPCLVEDEAKNRVNRRELVKQLRQLRNHIKSVYYDTDSIIQELKTNVEDSALNAEIRSRYVKSWQRARTEQNNETIRVKESQPLGQIEYYKQRSEHEHRVHTEIDLLINITINETLAKVDSWMSKYDKDIEAMDLKIQIMKNNYDMMLEKRKNLEKTVVNSINVTLKQILFICRNI
ncbi:unnamed protein product [Diatraea saccharalis]|uniref:Uncharacterized protein n=1 Tax=Diatraea saccharalis TaxID=40085 RepID=A0A9N9WCI0_9NEOP|nr:unnamed protein product [Diatraea saccharalis]